MKIMNLVFHPDLSRSRVNRVWKEQFEQSGKVITSRDLYGEYPDGKIDVAREQELLVAHDRIIFQFPFYWYSAPALLRQWQDDVLTYGFAYGSTGEALKGKDMQLVISAGGDERLYSGFEDFATLYDLLLPFRQTATFVQMNYMQPQWMFKADSASEDQIRQAGQNFVNMIDDPERSNGRDYIMTTFLKDAYEEVENNDHLKAILA